MSRISQILYYRRDWNRSTDFQRFKGVVFSFIGNGIFFNCIFLFIFLHMFFASCASADTLSHKVERRYGKDTVKTYKKLYNPGKLLPGKTQDHPEDAEQSAKVLKKQIVERTDTLNPDAKTMMESAIKGQEKALESWGQKNKDKPIFDMFKNLNR